MKESKLIGFVTESEKSKSERITCTRCKTRKMYFDPPKWPGDTPAYACICGNRIFADRSSQTIMSDLETEKQSKFLILTHSESVEDNLEHEPKPFTIKRIESLS